MSQKDDFNLDDLKGKVKEELKRELKKELLKEIYEELKTEEKTEEVDEQSSKPVIVQDVTHKPKKEITKVSSDEKVVITVPTFLKMATHAKKYANSNIPKERWVEVIGLLAAKLDEDNDILYIEDAYPMGHGNAVYAEIKDYKNFVTAYNDLNKKGLFICGWYHSHPSYGLWLSDEDLGTQRTYQTLWNKAVALVIDPYMIDGTSYGFDVFRSNLKKRKWFKIPFKLKGSIDVETLPELLKFINPIAEGRALFMEYDQDSNGG